MEAYSLDLRERICAACDDGIETRQEVADRFGVGRWFVQKLLRQRRDRFQLLVLHVDHLCRILGHRA